MGTAKLFRFLGLRKFVPLSHDFWETETRIRNHEEHSSHATFNSAFRSYVYIYLSVVGQWDRGGVESGKHGICVSHKLSHITAFVPRLAANSEIIGNGPLLPCCLLVLRLLMLIPRKELVYHVPGDQDPVMPNMTASAPCISS